MKDERVIGGFKYRMEQLGGMTGQLVLLRLARPWALILEAAASKGVTEASLAEIITSGGVSKALGVITDEDLAFVTGKLAERTVVFVPDGPQMREYPLTTIYDSHFAGRYAELVQWLTWGVKFNRLFVRAPSLESEAAGASASSSPPGSTGGAGASSSPASA